MHYFSPKELQMLVSFENKQLTGVHYILWQNLKREAGGYEALDWLLLEFADKTTLTLTTDEETTGIQIEDNFDFQKKEREIDKQFGGQVVLIKRDMYDEPPWIDAVGKTLTWVGLQEEGEGVYSRDAVRFDFDDWAVDVGLDEEGLKVDVGIS